MALSIYVNGSEKPNIQSCNYTAGINSRDPGDYSGATQQVIFTAPLTSDTYMDTWGTGALLHDNTAIIENGQVTSVNDNGGHSSNYTVAGLMSRLNRSGRVTPFNNTDITSVIHAYFTAAGVSVPIPDMPTTLIVTVPAWDGDLYDGLKQLLSAYGCYIYMDGDQPEVRQFDATDTLVDPPVNLVSKGRSVQAQDTVEWIKIAYYNNEYVTNKQVYPYLMEGPTTYSVGAEETLVYEVQLNASLASVNQPTAVNAINLSTIDTVGQYAVVDNAGAPIPAAEWIGQGGFVQVRLKDHQTLEVTIRGMKTARNNAPFRLAEFDRDAYPALYVTGTGVRTNRQEVRLHTGSSRAVPDSETTVENPFISTLEQAYTTGQWAASNGFFTQTADYSGGPELLLLGTKYKTYNGAYRTASIGLSPSGSSLSGSFEVTMKNFADTLGSKTMAQMAAIWPGKTMGQMALEPLRTA